MAAGTKLHANSTGVDFYHYWAVPLAQRRAGGELGSPYPNAAAYAATLQREAGATEDRRHHDVEAIRRRLDLTGTPLSYSVFGALPTRYSTALAWFRVAQVVSLFGAVLGLGAALGRRGPEVGALGATLAFGFHPFNVDLIVANLGTLQLAALVALGALVQRERACGPALVGAGLCGLVLLKPTLLLPCVALAVCVVARRGRAGLAQGVAGAAVAGGALLAWSIYFFRAPRVWIDWIEELQRSPDRIAYPVKFGNWSLAQVLAEQAGQRVGLWSALLTAALGLSALLALGSRWGRREAGGPEASSGASGVMHNPWWMLSLGIVGSLVSGVLVWSHYFTLGLLPILWLWWEAPADSRWRWVALGGLLLASPALVQLTQLLERSSLSQALVYDGAALALWFAVLFGGRDRVGREEADGPARTLTLVAGVLGLFVATQVAAQIVEAPGPGLALALLAPCWVLAAARASRRAGLTPAHGAALAAALPLGSGAVGGGFEWGALVDRWQGVLVVLVVSLGVVALFARWRRTPWSRAPAVVGALVLTAALALSGGSASLVGAALLVPAAALLVSDDVGAALRVGLVGTLALGSVSLPYLASRHLGVGPHVLQAAMWVPLWVGLLVQLSEAVPEPRPC